MTKKPKILFSDLDATLLNDRKEIEEQTRAAIDEMLARGHLFACCTGRPLASARAVAAQFGLDQEGCYIVSYNGGVIYDPSRDREVFRASVPLPAVRQMFQKARQAGLYVHTYDRNEGDTVLARQHTKEMDAYTSHTKLPFITGEDVLERLTEEPVKMIVISLDDHEKLQQFQKENAAWTEEHMSSFFSCQQYLEYCPAGISKGTALKRLCDHLNIPVEQSVAAGDERNDIEMLQAAGTGAVPRNAHPEAKEAADYLCEKDNNEGAVGEIIRKFILEPEI